MCKSFCVKFFTQKKIPHTFTHLHVGKHFTHLHNYTFTHLHVEKNFTHLQDNAFVASNFKPQVKKTRKLLTTPRGKFDKGRL